MRNSATVRGIPGRARATRTCSRAVPGVIEQAHANQWLVDFSPVYQSSPPRASKSPRVSSSSQVASAIMAACCWMRSPSSSAPWRSRRARGVRGCSGECSLVPLAAADPLSGLGLGLGLEPVPWQRLRSGSGSRSAWGSGTSSSGSGPGPSGTSGPGVSGIRDMAASNRQELWTPFQSNRRPPIRCPDPAQCGRGGGVEEAARPALLCESVRPSDHVCACGCVCVWTSASVYASAPRRRLTSRGSAR